MEWCHWLCVVNADIEIQERVPLCKHFHLGHCLYGDSCAFRHVISEAVERSRPRHGSYQRRKIYNEGKAAALRRWLVCVFGEHYMRSGSGVLDVAGGKGELAFELMNLNGVPCTVVDPRPLQLRRYQRKLQFGYYHRNDALALLNSRPRPDSDEQYETPRHIRTFFEVEVPVAARASSRFVFPAMLADDSGEQFCVEISRASRISWTEKGLTHEDAEAVCVEDEDDPAEGDAAGLPGDCLGLAEAREIVGRASMVVGMHPDQATEHIVDFCLLNRVPFAVVPCCVYSREFPRRRHPTTGDAVREYGDFIEYLLGKSAEVRVVEMDFEGKNILLYYLGACVPLSPPGNPSRRCLTSCNTLFVLQI